MPPEDAEAVLGAMKSHPLATEAAVIGQVTAEHPGFVLMKTRVRGTRVVDMLSGEQLPRILLKFFWSGNGARPIVW